MRRWLLALISKSKQTIIQNKSPGDEPGLLFYGDCSFLCGSGCGGTSRLLYEGSAGSQAGWGGGVIGEWGLGNLKS
jgi:hypothetical protein